MENIIKMLKDENIKLSKNKFFYNKDFFKNSYTIEKNDYYSGIVLSGYLSSRLIKKIMAYTDKSKNLDLICVKDRLFVMNLKNE